MSPLSSSGHLVRSFFTNGPPYTVVFFLFCRSGMLKSCTIFFDSTNDPSHHRLISPQVQFRIHVAQN